MQNKPSSRTAKQLPTNPTENLTSNSTLRRAIDWNQSQYCLNTMRSIKENVVMEVLPPLTMRHIPSIGAI
jgi:hypothetical protein